MATQTLQNIITSKLFSLNTRDWLRGLAMAIITAVLTSVYSFTQSVTGIHGINWDLVLTVGINSALGYILLNLGTGSRLIVKNPSDATIEAVKAGDAKVTVTTLPSIQSIKN